MPFGPNIPTERQWLTQCVILGWKLRDIPALRRFYREVHPPKTKPAAGLFAVSYHGHVLPNQFSSPDIAETWALENYKGTRDGWEVIPI